MAIAASAHQPKPLREGLGPIALEKEPAQVFSLYAPLVIEAIINLSARIVALGMADHDESFAHSFPLC